MSRDNKIILLSIFLIFFELACIYYLKYNVNGLRLSDFSIFVTGNMINFVITILIAGGLLAHLITDKKNKASGIRIVLSLIVFSFIPVFVLGLLYFFGISLPDSYLWGYPIRKVINGILFFMSQFILIYIIIFLFNLLFEKTLIIYLKAFIRTIYVIVLMALITFIYTLIFSVDEIMISDEEYYDIGVVLGAAVWSYDKPSPVFEGRIKKSYELFQKGVIPEIQLTGGNAPGEITEAEAAYNYLRNLGVSPIRMRVEKNSSTTSEQIRYIRNNILRKEKYKSIIIITDKFHLRRVLEMCRFYRVEAKGVASDYNLGWEKELFYRFRDSVGLLLFWIFAI
ncbi:MAG: hypothetical protein SCALA702_35160 [Melioribacteraceae bacterium]|nr:MAG: hypothetical protein SCALA702_35160 [Melioribacteraceae bacterium]